MALIALVAALKLWMLLDATRRGVHVLWYVVLCLPCGELFYFFAVKLRDFGGRELPAAPDAPAPPPRPTAEELEHEAQLSPSFDNRIAAAFALLEVQQPERAERFFELALRTHPKDREALHGLGLARLERGDHAGAIDALSQLTERAFAYDDYGAALALCEARFRAGDVDDALALVTEMIRSSRRFEHHLVLARYQLRAARKADARVTLRSALAEFEAQPELERRRNGASATEARRLLRTLVPDEPAL